MPASTISPSCQKSVDFIFKIVYNIIQRTLVFSQSEYTQKKKETYMGTYVVTAAEASASTFDYVVAIMGLLGGLGVLLYGFKVLSESIEKLANDRLRSWFSKTSKTGKLAGLGIGIVTTTVIQSSSATTVMTVGFVNAGVMSLTMATAIIMGANIGTTITAQIAALSAFDFAAFLLPLAAIGIFMDMLCKNDKLKTLGMIIGGLGLVFVALDVMSTSMNIFRDALWFQDALKAISNPFLLIIIGLAFTALVQSSSAVTSIIVALVSVGNVQIGDGGNSVLFLILGTNIGTCITALLSSIGANTNAKRAALIHLMFNVFGTVLFTILLLIWNDFNRVTFQAMFPTAPATQIAMFHTFFNTVCVLLFFPFINLFVKLACLIIRDKKGEVPSKEINTFLDDRLLETPAIAVMQAKKEIARIAEESVTTLKNAIDCFYVKDMDGAEKVREKIKDINEESRKVTQFLIKLSSSDVSYGDEKAVSAMHSAIADALRIADLADNMVKYTRHYINDRLEFSESVLSEIKLMSTKVEKLFTESMLAFNDVDVTAVVRAEEYENEIDSLRRHIIDNHIKRLNEGRCQPQSSSVLINLVGNLERAADHILNLAHTFD